MGDVQFVGDHDDGDAAVVQSLKGIHDFDASLSVEIASWFVGKKQRGIHYQQPGNGPPLLSAGKLVGQGIRSIRQADEIQSFVRAFPLLFSAERRLRIKHGQLDVVAGGSARRQVESLKDKPNFLVPNFRPFFGRQA